MASTRRKYGLDWPAEIHDVQIDLICAKKWREKPFCDADLLDPWEHLLRACRALFTHEQMSISPWTEAHAVDWTTELFCVTLGCASCSKSNDYGAFALLDWLTDPVDTVTILASTTKEMLKIRSYESVIRYYKILKSSAEFYIPAKESKQITAILNEADPDQPGMDAATDKASIRGVAVQAGTANEARANLQGAHLPYVRLILDEMAAMREAAVDARVNLSIGAKDFRFFGLANPDSFFDLSCQYSEPNDGWGSVDENSTDWRTRFGKVRHHNGFDSPAVTEPNGVEKYPYLIKQADIDRALAETHGNQDDPQIWTMIKGFPPTAGLEKTVLTQQDITAFNAEDDCEWRNQIVGTVAGLDPAFTAEGDGCVLQFADVGLTTDFRYRMLFGDTVYIPIEASSERPVVFQILDKCIEELGRRGVPLQNLAVDDSGTQSVADVLDNGMRGRCLRCNFGARASEKPASRTDDTPAKQRFGNQATELWMHVAELVRNDHIRGLPKAACKQLCQRVFKRAVASTVLQRLESKADFKKRTGLNSPDEADAAALCVRAARVRYGLLPGCESLSVDPARPQGPTGMAELKQKLNRAFSNNYLASTDWKRLNSYETGKQ